RPPWRRGPQGGPHCGIAKASRSTRRPRQHLVCHPWQTRCCAAATGAEARRAHEAAAPVIAGVMDGACPAAAEKHSTEESVMIIETSRCGPLQVDERRLIPFPKGILGFPDQQEYALIQTAESSA